jgi:ATP-dependent Clp protease ATP-binding subunit ClpB
VYCIPLILCCLTVIQDWTVLILFFSGATNGAMDAGNLLKPMLGRGELRCIGATTLDEYRKYIEKDPALERRFQQVYVDQPTVEDTISILRGLRERYELHHGVCISDSALVGAAVLSDRYISGRFLPDKGENFIFLFSIFRTRRSEK